VGSNSITVINVFTVEPAKQQELVNLLSNATEGIHRVPDAHLRRLSLKAFLREAPTNFCVRPRIPLNPRRCYDLACELRG
jgi:hypothetical protein